MAPVSAESTLSSFPPIRSWRTLTHPPHNAQRAETSALERQRQTRVEKSAVTSRSCLVSTRSNVVVICASCSGVGERELRSQCWWSGRRVDRVFNENVFRVSVQFGLGEDGPAAFPPAAAVRAAVAGGV